MSRTNLKHIKRIFTIVMVACAGILAFSNFNGFNKVVAEENPEISFDDVSTYVDNEYDSYLEEQYAAYIEKYKNNTIVTSDINHINASNYYKEGTDVYYNGEFVAIKAIISNGYLFKEESTSYNYDSTIYEVINVNDINKDEGVSLDLIANKTVILKQDNENGTTYYRENVQLANLQNVKYDEMLLQQDEGKVTWKVVAPKAGFYNLAMSYYPITGNSSNIERSLAINGKIPFDGADTFSFSRIWQDRESSYEFDKDGNKIGLKTDVKGNDLKPKQVENPYLLSAYFRDDMGYVNEPYMFYLNEGENYITFVSVKEPVLIDEIILEGKTFYSTWKFGDIDSNIETKYNDDVVSKEGVIKENGQERKGITWWINGVDTNIEFKDVTPVKALKQKGILTYSEYLALHSGKANATKSPSRIEAENTFTKSSPTLYPSTDRSSSQTYPFSYTTTKLNVIGGTNWQVLGDWITWKVTVPEDGFYNISMRAKQNMVRGMYSSRKVYINDEILFDELNDVQFKYKNNWQIVTLGNDKEDFLFYLEAGQTYTIKMEVTLGQYAPLIEDLQVCIDELSAIYRMIIAHTTVTPKAGTDYQLKKNFPSLESDLIKYRDELVRISNEISSISGGKSDKTGVIDNVVIQLNDFIKDVEIIPTRLSTFSSNVSSLGTLLNTLRELPLQLDWIWVHAPEEKLPAANENFFRKIWDSIVSFVLSFFLDYSSISQTEEQEIVGEVVDIDVWMTLGRDQANVIRSLIDTDFAKKNPNIRVELKLTAGDVLLKATLAGIGPDVALNVDSSLPVNYALRNAVMDLSDRIYEYEYKLETKDGKLALGADKLPIVLKDASGSYAYATDSLGNKVIQATYLLAEDMKESSDSSLPTITDIQLFMNKTYPTYFDALREEIRVRGVEESAVEKELIVTLSREVVMKAGMAIPTYLYQLYPSMFSVLRNIDNSKIESKLVKDQDFLMIPQYTDFNFWEQTGVYSYANNVYMESSLRQFQFQYDYKDGTSGYGTYSLPEKQIFLMMFVRDDIMSELGLTDMIPNTWDEMIDLIAELQTDQLQFYLPVNSEGASALNPIFVSKLYQQGARIYASDNRSTGFKSDEAMKAFEEWTEYYTLYSFPLAANFTNRFRSGEQPIGISYYELYNTLSVFAPELKGRWSFHQIPGTQKEIPLVDEDGNKTGETVEYIDRTAVASGTGCVMMRQSGGSAKYQQDSMDAAWEFMKWWSSAETQTSFGREMEGILGSAARHTTANVKALQQLAWRKSDLTVLMQQWSSVHEIPQIAGSYITGREIENAYRQVINNGYNPREVLYEYAGKIDIEIDRKRQEFGLKMSGEGNE